MMLDRAKAKEVLQSMAQHLEAMEDLALQDVQIGTDKILEETKVDPSKRTIPTTPELCLTESIAVAYNDAIDKVKTCLAMLNIDANGEEFEKLVKEQNTTLEVMSASNRVQLSEIFKNKNVEMLKELGISDDLINKVASGSGNPFELIQEIVSELKR